MIQVSVVVPTHNRKTDLEKCLEALLSQTYPADQFEILVADDGSSDGTKQLVEQFRSRTVPSIRWLGQPRNGPAAARNLGISNARGEWVAMTDDDCQPEPDWLESFCSALTAHPEWAGCGGSIVRRNDSPISRYIDDYRIFDHPIHGSEVWYLVTANAIYRKAVLDEVGGFEESIDWPGGEDFDLSHRIRQRGYHLGVEPRSVIRHKHRDTLIGLYRMFKIMGRGNAARYKLGRMDREYYGRRSNLEGFRKALSLLRRRDMRLSDRCRFALYQMIQVYAFSNGYNQFLERPTTLLSGKTL
jgi:glycosyltransferase involved in cell wall biosynthesis